MKEVAFTIPVYKIRTNHLFEHVNDLAKEFDVYIFTQTNCHDDFITLSKMKEDEHWADNVFVEECDCDNIAKKRYCMSNRIMDLGYKGMFMCDDDIKFDLVTTEGCERRGDSDFWKKQKINMVEAAKVMIDASKKYDAIYVSPSNNELATACSAPGTVSVNKGLIWTCFVYIDLVKMKESGIQFIQVFDTFEQHDIQIQFLLNGYNTIILHSYCFISSQTDTNSAIFGQEPVAHARKLDTLFMNLFLKYGDYICLHYRNKTKLARIGCRMRWDWMTSNVGKMFMEPKTEKTQKLYELAKKGNLDDFLEALKNK